MKNESFRKEDSDISTIDILSFLQFLLFSFRFVLTQLVFNFGRPTSTSEIHMLQKFPVSEKFYTSIYYQRARFYSRCLHHYFKQVVSNIREQNSHWSIDHLRNLVLVLSLRFYFSFVHSASFLFSYLFYTNFWISLFQSLALFQLNEVKLLRQLSCSLFP